MSYYLSQLEGAERRAECDRNDAAMRIKTHRVTCCDLQGHDCRQGRDCQARQGYPTSRRHPRTLADAFPDERAKAFHPHEPAPVWQRVALFLRRLFA